MHDITSATSNQSLLTRDELSRRTALVRHYTEKILPEQYERHKVICAANGVRMTSLINIDDISDDDHSLDLHQQLLEPSKDDTMTDYNSINTDRSCSDSSTRTGTETDELRSTSSTDASILTDRRRSRVKQHSILLCAFIVVFAAVVLFVYVFRR